MSGARLGIRSLHKMGKLWRGMIKNIGGRPEETGCTVQPVNAPLTYTEMGIDKTGANEAGLRAVPQRNHPSRFHLLPPEQSRLGLQWEFDYKQYHPTLHQPL